MAWILVLSPPRERPIAWFSPSFLDARTVLMGSHNCTVDYAILVVSIGGEMLEHALPHARFCPAAETPMRISPVAEAFR
jgi:hypothetical protein